MWVRLPPGLAAFFVLPRCRMPCGRVPIRNRLYSRLVHALKPPQCITRVTAAVVQTSQKSACGYNYHGPGQSAFKLTDTQAAASDNNTCNRSRAATSHARAFARMLPKPGTQMNSSRICASHRNNHPFTRKCTRTRPLRKLVTLCVAAAPGHCFPSHVSSAAASSS